MAVVGKYVLASNIDNWAEDVTQTEMQEIIDKIEETVERITKDVFYPKTFHLFLNGNGKKQIFPYFTSKILSVNKMSISDVEIDTDDFTGSNSSGISGAYTVNITEDGITEDYYQNDYLGIYDASESVNYYWGTRIITNTATSSGISTFTLEKALPVTLASSDTVSLITNWDWDENSIFRNKPVTTHEPGDLMEPWEFFLDGYFPKGDRNVEIWGTYGWFECPKNIKEACIIMAKYENDNTTYTSYSDIFQSERLGDYSYTKANNKVYLTGIAEADKKLERYVRRKVIIGVV